jgi:hypothetical protein
MIVTRLRAGAAGLLLITALSACTGSPGSSGVATLQSPGAGESDPSASPSASLDPETARLEFARCMREHGIDVPDPGSGGGGAVAIGGDKADVEKMQTAMEACDQFLGEALGAPTEIDPEMQDKMLEFAECMRDNGVDFPDPGADGGGRITIGGKDGIDPSSPEFQAAQEACQSILGDLGPTFNGGPGGGDGPNVQVAP